MLVSGGTSGSLNPWYWMSLPPCARKPIRSGLIRVQNRRQRLTRNAHLIVRVSWVGDPVERSIIPVGIVEDEVLEEGNSNLCVMVGLLRRRRLRRNAERPVIGFAARLKWRVVVVLLQDLISARADISDCFNLLCPKAVRRLLRSLAQKLLGIEGASVGDHSGRHRRHHQEHRNQR